MSLEVTEVRVVLADSPVRRPHTMSFTTLDAVNFAFVRVATDGGLAGWGEATCFTPHDALAIARLGGVSILSLKVTKSAGLLGTMAIARIAEAAGLGGYVDGMIETSLGTAAYLHGALAAAPVTWGCELFGPLLLGGDVVHAPVRYADGAILALDRSGLGVEVDAVDEARLKEWARRA